MTAAAQVEVDVEDVSGSPGNPSEAQFQRWTAAAFAGRRDPVEVLSLIHI